MLKKVASGSYAISSNGSGLNCVVGVNASSWSKASLALGAIKSVATTYDLVTLPAYAATQRPWKNVKLAKAIRSKRVDPDDPYSPWVRVGTPKSGLMEKFKSIGYSTVPELLSAAFRVHAEKNCYGYREILDEEEHRTGDGKVLKKFIMSDDIHWVTFKEVDEMVTRVATGLHRVGVRSGDRVIIFADTRPEWGVTANAVQRLGATVCTLYVNLGDPGLVHGFNLTSATHVITSKDLMEKIYSLEAQIPKVNTIIYMDHKVKSKRGQRLRPAIRERFRVIPLREIIKCGQIELDDQEKSSIKKPSLDDVGIMIFTSGSTGNPKAVMINHRNSLSACETLLTTIMSDYVYEPHELFIGYLPMSHLFELATEFLMHLQGIPIGNSDIIIYKLHHMYRAHIIA